MKPQSLWGMPTVSLLWPLGTGLYFLSSPSPVSGFFQLSFHSWPHLHSVQRPLLLPQPLQRNLSVPFLSFTLSSTQGDVAICHQAV